MASPEDLEGYKGASDSKSAPSGSNGPEPEPFCRCGAGPHPELPDRCSGGHMTQGNLAAALVGERSVRFWREHAAARRELQRAVIRDRGVNPDDSPPKALELAADSIAQAALLQAAAYARLAEVGGPITSRGRTRAVFEVWTRATDRLERHLRLVGLKRRQRQVESVAQYVANRVATRREGSE